MLLGQIGVVPVIGDVAGRALSVTAKLTGVPTPHALVSVTLTFPAVVPNVTVMAFVPCPAVIVAPAGTVQL